MAEVIQSMVADSGAQLTEMRVSAAAQGRATGALPIVDLLPDPNVPPLPLPQATGGTGDPWTGGPAPPQEGSYSGAGEESTRQTPGGVLIQPRFNVIRPHLCRTSYEV